MSECHSKVIRDRVFWGGGAGISVVEKASLKIEDANTRISSDS
jgi:hypothetical protein